MATNQSIVIEELSDDMTDVDMFENKYSIRDRIWHFWQETAPNVLKKHISMEDMQDINKSSAVAEYVEDIMKDLKAHELKYRA